jgi:hypothetical protein
MEATEEQMTASKEGVVRASRPNLVNVFAVILDLAVCGRELSRRRHIWTEKLVIFFLTGNLKRILAHNYSNQH